MSKFCDVRSIVTAAVLVTAAMAAAEDAWVRFSEDGQRIVVDAEGVSKFEGVSAARWKINGEWQQAGTRNKMLEPVRESTGTTPFGEAVVSTARYGNDQFQYTLTLKRLKSQRAFTLQGVLHNLTDQDINLHIVSLLDMTKPQGGGLEVANPADWLVTPLMHPRPAEPLSEMTGNIQEAAMVYHANGNGFLLGPVGPPEAHVMLQLGEQGVHAFAQMDDVLVRAGESRRSEEIIVSFEPSATSIDVWTRWVAATHGVRRNKPPVYGWCSWYDRTTKIDAKHFLDVTKTIAENPNTFGRGLIQIDDGFQVMDGDWSANEKFPDGMADLAKKVKEANGIPAIWFAPLMIHPEHPWGKENPDAIQKGAGGMERFMNPNPFHPAGANWIRSDHPKGKKFLFDIIRTARDNGYEYIKIDFNGIGDFVDPTKTRLQIMRGLYTLYREAAGEEMYILSCLGNPTRGVIGFIDAARIGPDSHPASFEHCLESVLRFQIYDNVWWQNDPDVSYIAPKLESRWVGHTQTEGLWKSWHNIVTLVGGAAMISEPVNADDAKAKWRNYEIMRPSSAEPARLLTLGNSPNNTTLGFVAKRPYGDFAVYNLYNVMEGSNALTLDFEEAGLPKGVKCAVYDFWENKVIGYATDSYTTAPLEHLYSDLLRFTPLTSDRPTLVGSDLHLSIGATEIDNLRVAKSSITIELNNEAGAQEGSLTFHSAKVLAVGESENCEVTSVENLGGDLWKVNITGRQWGEKQVVTLTVK